MTESAMVLTDDEWQAIGHVASHYLMATAWADDPAQHTGCSRFGKRQPPTQALLDQRAICKRIMEAL